MFTYDCKSKPPLVEVSKLQPNIKIVSDDKIIIVRRRRA